MSALWSADPDFTRDYHLRTGAYALISHFSEPEVKVLCAGFVVREKERVVDASSTVTLITSGQCMIIVDTGSPGRMGLLRERIKEVPLAAEAVQRVVNTHLHADHCGGNDLFTEAMFLAHALEDAPPKSIKVGGGFRISDGITVLETPGHTLDSITVLVESDRKYAICGDAIPTKANYDSNAPPAIHIDRRMAMESMEKILEWADVVIPGHDNPFEPVRKK
ncbi:MAG: MBL fold metallo-hydrolase [Methanobacteriota archaeon]|nr:MAG: MBL fold metallo-hydrolase [Euryarchaeota archaeon]